MSENWEAKDLAERLWPWLIVRWRVTQFCEWTGTKPPVILKSYIQTIKPSPLYLTVIDSENQRRSQRQIDHISILDSSSQHPAKQSLCFDRKHHKRKVFLVSFFVTPMAADSEASLKREHSSKYSSIHSFPQCLAIHPNTLQRKAVCMFYILYSLVLPITTNYKWVPVLEKMLCWSYVFCQKCSFSANKSVLGLSFAESHHESGFSKWWHVTEGWSFWLDRKRQLLRASKRPDYSSPLH